MPGPDVADPVQATVRAVPRPARGPVTTARARAPIAAALRGVRAEELWKWADAPTDHPDRAWLRRDQGAVSAPTFVGRTVGDKEQTAKSKGSRQTATEKQREQNAPLAAEQAAFRRSLRSRPGSSRCACGGIRGPDGECAACKARRLRGPAGPRLAPPIVHDVLRSHGPPLEPGVRGEMEARFGRDFSRVRVHTDARAAQSARAVNALAYTVGKDVVFDSGRYAPQTGAGRHLLAHELAHVVQQRSIPGPQHPARLEIGAAVSTVEDEAKSASAIGGTSPAAKPVVELNQALLQRTCRAYPERSHYESAPNYCRDTPGTSQLHPGQTCFREVPRRSSYFDCPPADQVCFDDEGRCFDSWDEASCVESKDADGTCNLHFACSIAHAWKDKVIQSWLDQTLEEMGRHEMECVRMCNTQPWYLRGLCLQGCSRMGDRMGGRVP